MRISEDNPREESGAHRLAALLRKSATESVNEQRDQASWREILRGAHEEDARSVRASRFRPWMLAPVAAGLALVTLVSVRLLSPPSLRFTTESRAPLGNDVATEDRGQRSLEFSDGSTLVLASSSRLRVIGTDADGATLRLERGQVDAAIRHRPSSRWRFELGPYVIQVIGTRFSASWNPETGDVGVELREGAVSVRGPGISSPITVQGGQQFRANRVGNYNVQYHRSADPMPSVAETPATPSAPAVKPRLALVDNQRPASPPSHERPVCAWAGLVSRGQFAEVMAAAYAMGIEAALTQCPPPSLFALADAARYEVRFELSREALLAVRKRAPELAGKAAFFLGRLDEARGNLTSALAWYTQAVESGRGTPFLQEARAGRARMSKRLQTLDGPPSTP